MYLFKTKLLAKITLGFWGKFFLWLIGAPIALVVIIYLLIILFAAILPKLDLSIGDRKDRTIASTEGNYKDTFLKTGRETNGEYELVEVEIAPKGGNGWHYHKTFQEQFTAIKGNLTVGLDGETLLLKEGDSAVAPKGVMHYFHNATDSTIIIHVKATPARGLEKSIRVAYGLMNDGKWKSGSLFPKNIWHLFLILGYSESYLKGIPGFIQEPLINALARIAQWKGEDKDLKKYFE